MLLNKYIPYVTPTLLCGFALFKLVGKFLKQSTSIFAAISDSCSVSSGNFISLEITTFFWLIISPGKNDKIKQKL